MVLVMKLDYFIRQAMISFVTAKVFDSRSDSDSKINRLLSNGEDGVERDLLSLQLSLLNLSTLSAC